MFGDPIEQYKKKEKRIEIEMFYVLSFMVVTPDTSQLDKSAFIVSLLLNK